MTTTPNTGTDGMTNVQATIYSNVHADLQSADDDGVLESAEYIALMEDVVAECKERIAAFKVMDADENAEWPPQRKRDRLTDAAEEIYQNVHASMQDAEEIWGPGPEGYELLMTRIAEEAQRRADACEANDAMDQRDVLDSRNWANTNSTL